MPFSLGAMDKIYESGGIPSRINQIRDATLISTATQRLVHITDDLIVSLDHKSVGEPDIPVSLNPTKWQHLSRHLSK